VRHAAARGGGTRRRHAAAARGGGTRRRHALTGPLRPFGSRRPTYLVIQKSRRSIPDPKAKHHR